MAHRTIKLGGAERSLKYDLNAISEIGDRLDIKVRLSHVGEDIMGTPLPLKAIRTILWAGLLHERPDLDEMEVGKWVDQDNMAEVMQFFFGFFSSTSPDLQEQVAAKMGLEDAESSPPTKSGS